MKKSIYFLLILFSPTLIFAQSTQIGSSPIYYNSGNVGIGTVNPTFLFHLESSATTGMILHTNSSNNTSRIYFKGQRETIGTSSHFIGTEGVGNYNFEVNIDENFLIKTNSVERFRVTGNGKVGIGTDSPDSKLRIDDTYSLLRFEAVDGQFRIRSTRLAGYSFSDLLLSSQQNIILYPDGNGTAYSGGGNVGIGTTSPTEKLSVDGTVLAKGVRVSTAGGDWPDYVFTPSFKLRTLNELEAFIMENQHLPEVPSANEIKTKGQDLGKIQTILLKKIEELTLYLIDENKEKEALKRENQKLKDLLLSLKQDVEILKGKLN